MIVLPAVDLKDGRCVRLQKGDFNTVHQVADSPVSVALEYASLGAQWMHLVDLDGAKDGVRKNAKLVREIVQKSGLQVELGGGIRGLADVEEAFALGVSRVVIGSAAVSNPAFVGEAVRAFGDKIAVGIDALEDTVRTAGWVEDSGIPYLQFAQEMAGLGVSTFVFTDIATDGMLEGPSFEKLTALSSATKAQIVASGGVTTNEDVRRLASMGLYGAIVGKAYYAGTIDLKRAIEEGRVC